MFAETRAAGSKSENNMRPGRHGSIVHVSARCALLVLALAGTGGAAAAQSGLPSGPVPLPRERPAAALVNDVHCVTQEDQCLKQLGGLARREGDHLRLRLANGKTRAFTTTDACAAGVYEKCLQYRLIGYFPRHRYFLVNVGFLNHGGVTFLVSGRNGEYVKLDQLPHFSPSGRRIASVNATEMDGENSIEIWSTATDPPTSEWRYVVPENEYSLYQFVAWDGDDRLKMTVITRIGEELHDPLPVEAIRTRDGWKLMPPILDGSAGK
jgi:hypothetical protein